MTNLFPRAGMLARVLPLLFVAACSEGVQQIVTPDFADAPPGSTLSLRSGDDQLGTSGQPLPKGISVELKDASGNPVYGVYVDFQVLSGGGSLAAARRRTTTAGIATNTWTLGNSGTQSARAYVAGVGEVIFTATRLDDLTLSIDRGNYQVAAAGSTLPILPRVELLDSEDNPVAGLSVNWTISGGGSLLRSTQKTNALGQSTNTWTLGPSGAQQITATVPGVGSVNFKAFLMGELDLVLRSGNNQSGPAGSLLTRKILVELTSDGEPVPGRTVSWTVTSGNGSVQTATSKTNSIGVASNYWTLGASGSQSVQVSTVGAPGTVTFNATLTASAVAFSQLTVGTNHACALLGDGTAYCWGSDAAAQLGNGNPGEVNHPTAVATATKFASISTGETVTCARTSAGQVYCWGLNNFGQLGTGSFSAANNCGVPCAQSPVASATGIAFNSISAGAGHVCGLTSGGVAYCWGANGSGQLGNGDQTNQPGPVQVNGGFTFARISAGADHTCGVTTGGAAYCWGANHFGQIGALSAPNPSLTPKTVVGGYAWTEIMAGASSFSCGIVSGGTLRCWGSNRSGQLGIGNPNPGYTACSYDSGKPYKCSEPIPVFNGPNFVSIAGRIAGSAGGNACGLSTSGSAYCWGDNQYGQLGLGTKTGPTSCYEISHCANAPTAVPGYTFTAVGAGSTHACALTGTGDIYCWGRNFNGQLGDGTFDERLSPKKISTAGL